MALALFYDCIAKKKDRELSIWGLSEGWVPGQIRVQNSPKGCISSRKVVFLIIQYDDDHREGVRGSLDQLSLLNQFPPLSFSFF